jgi:DNA (cytosine-5)-methyltransferase 1
MNKLRVLDLFSGIGGFSLGLERAGGFETVAFCEIEEYPRRVLAKHWPGVKQYDDVRTLTADTLRRDGIAVDVICGGFPCQDISVAGRGAGLAGERSGLWREYARLIRELRPRFVIVENVAALLSRGLGDVLGDLAALGYDAEWHCIPAAAVGAPHRRDRLWIVANSARSERAGERAVESRQQNRPANRRETLANANPRDEHGRRGSVQMGWGRFAGETLNDGYTRGTEWSPEPDVGRVAHGVPSRVDRLGALGNAVVPQIPELIGRAIMQAEGLA